MRLVRYFFKDGVANFKNCHILNYTSYKQELLQLENKEPLIADIGKNAEKIKLKSEYKFIENSKYKSGDFFYLWSKPLFNHYLTIITL